MASTPPKIFSPARRLAARRRMLALQALPGAPRYLIDHMVEDVLDRLSFLRHEAGRALIVGDYSGSLAIALRTQGAGVIEADPASGFDDERPSSWTGLALIVTLGTLDTVNDLPGALIHMRNALAPGGLMIASFPGAGSLVMLRAAMLSADGDRPAPRIHPQIDVRAGAQLLQRTGFSDPVADGWPVQVSFRSLGGLVTDLRAQGLSNVLTDPGPPLGKAALETARLHFAESGTEGRTTERFEIVTLSGWRP